MNVSPLLVLQLSTSSAPTTSTVQTVARRCAVVRLCGCRMNETNRALFTTDTVCLSVAALQYLGGCLVKHRVCVAALSTALPVALGQVGTVGT
jgi:hypothetical protein